MLLYFFIKPSKTSAVKNENSLTTQSKACDMMIKETCLLFCHKSWKHMHVSKRKLERNSSLEPYHETNSRKKSKLFWWIFKEWSTSQIGEIMKTFQNNNTSRVVRWGYLGQFLLGMYRWPLRTPTPLIYCEANYRPHLSHFWANVTYFATSCLCIYLKA